MFASSIRYYGDPTKDYSAIIDTYIRRFLLLTHKFPFRRTYQSNDIQFQGRKIISEWSRYPMIGHELNKQKEEDRE